MSDYINYIRKIVDKWKKQMRRNPSFVNKRVAALQKRINKIYPKVWHDSITKIVKEMVRGVLFGARYISPRPKESTPFIEREMEILKRIDQYKTTGAIEGAVTGGAGLLLGIADFPLLLSIKLKLLFDIAGLYGFDVKDHKERIFILYVFQLTFSSKETQQQTFEILENWNEFQTTLPDDIHTFDWLQFQQQYRDYLDLAKLAQLIPIIGAPIGAFVNHRLIKKLGNTAMQAYRMRILDAADKGNRFVL
jgi:hypothetical protein